MVGRVEIQSDNILEFVNEPGIPAQLEAPHQVRLQTVLFPDTPNGSRAQTRSGSHAARAPLRRSLRLLIERPLYYLSHSGFVYTLLSPRLGTVTKQTCHTRNLITGAPPSDRRRGSTQLLLDSTGRQAVRTHYSDARSQRRLLRRVPVSGYSFQRGLVRVAHGQSFARPHASIIA